MPRTRRLPLAGVGRVARAAGAAIGRPLAANLFWRLPFFLVVFAACLYPAVQLMPQAAHPDQDMTHFRLWTQWIQANGIELAYSGLFPSQYIIYPPLSIYFFQLVGQILQLYPAPPEWLLQYWPDDGFWIGAVIRLPVVAFHGAITAVIFWSTVRWKGTLWAAIASLSYALNPAVLFDLVFWAQPDSYHSFFAVIGLLALLSRWPEYGWAALALASLAKPQAWIYLPLLLLVTWRRHGLGKVMSGAVFFVVTAIAVVWPWVTADRFWELASVFVNFSRVMPVVTANAHNLWWGLLGQAGLFKADSSLVWGPVSYQTVGFVLLILFYVAALIKPLGDGDRKTLFSAAGFMSLAFFFFATQIHENHAFLVFPMLAMAWIADWRLGLVYLTLSATMFANLALHDPILEPLAGAWILEQLPEWVPAGLRDVATPEKIATFSVFANLGAIGIWLMTFIWGGPGPVTSAERQRRAGWVGMVGGAGTAVAVIAAVYLLISEPGPPPDPDAGVFDGRISLKPVEEPHVRIVTGGGGIETPDSRRLQSILVAAGAAAATSFVTFLYVSHQGMALRRD